MSLFDFLARIDALLDFLATLMLLHIFAHKEPFLTNLQTNLDILLSSLMISLKELNQS